METTAGSVVAGLLVSVAIFVYFNGPESPRFIPADLKPGTYSRGGLQAALLDLFSRMPSLGITSALISHPKTKVFVRDPPHAEEGEDELITPPRPEGKGLGLGAKADIAEGKYVLLDLGDSLPAAAAPAAGGAAAGGAAGPPDYKLFARSLLAELKAEEEADKASVATPKEYEETGRQYIVSLLESNFGLRIVPNASLHRLDKEITAVLKGAVFDSEWDFRAPVLCSGPGPQTPGKTDDFVIYPDREAYIRPARPARGKVLTPTKIGAAEAPPPCDFIAIFEITTEADWTGNLLPRLEQRLAVSLDRARSLDASVSGILDVVAVIGVLGIAPWQRRMTSRVTAAKTPLLFEMMQASRFVFLYRDYAGSPHRSIAGRSGGKGGAGTGPQGPRGPLSPLAAAGGGGGTE